jgi:hypothetical protein
MAFPMRMPGVSRSRTLPPPTEGWDTREALADMPITRAVILDNWFPSTDKITLRRGSSSHATGMSGSVESLLPYTGVTGTAALFAANGGNIYDVTVAGAVGAAVVSGMTNDRWQSVQIGTAGGQFLLAFNGADTPRTYNGSAWSTAGMTGPTAANLIWANLHQRRLWFGEKDSLSAWYLAVNAITGAATEFPLAGLADKGGYIMAMGTWTRDSGAGADDVAVFLTSEGQAIIYEGTDPSSASTWSLVGVFNIAKPIGRRCMVKWGGDLIFVTQDGFIPASSLTLERAEQQKAAVSAQINKAVNDAVRLGGSLFGWQPIVYPKGTMLVFNIPQSGTTAHQYVFNTITKAPCRFKGMNALCWGLLNDNLYFGGTDGKVYKADDGKSDNSSAIMGDALQAFSDLGMQGVDKRVNLVEPIFESDGNPNAALDLNTDYQVRAPTAVSAASANTSATWGVSKWGIGTWGTATQIFRGWRGVRGKGRTVALRVRVSTTTARPSWVATNMIYTPAGQL